MGVTGSKKLPKEDMQFLMDNTNFTKQQIKAWYKGFMVSVRLTDFTQAQRLMKARQVALLSQRGRAMLHVCTSFNNTVRRAQVLLTSFSLHFSELSLYGLALDVVD